MAFQRTTPESHVTGGTKPYCVCFERNVPLAFEPVILPLKNEPEDVVEKLPAPLTAMPVFDVVRDVRLPHVLRAAYAYSEILPARVSVKQIGLPCDVLPAYRVPLSLQVSPFDTAAGRGSENAITPSAASKATAVIARAICLDREHLRLRRASQGQSGMLRTIFPSCSPASSRSCAARVSDSGNTESTTTLARPDVTSS